MGLCRRRASQRRAQLFCFGPERLPNCVQLRGAVRGSVSFSRLLDGGDKRTCAWLPGHTRWHTSRRESMQQQDLSQSSADSTRSSIRRAVPRLEACGYLLHTHRQKRVKGDGRSERVARQDVMHGTAATRCIRGVCIFSFFAHIHTHTYKLT